MKKQTFAKEQKSSGVRELKKQCCRWISFEARSLKKHVFLGKRFLQERQPFVFMGRSAFPGKNKKHFFREPPVTQKHVLLFVFGVPCKEL